MMKAQLPSEKKGRDYVSLRILVTGASGNLGSEIARQLAQPGVSLSLWGRDAAKLEATAQQCRLQGAETTCTAIDLSEIDAALTKLAHEDNVQPFDIVMLVAGQGKTQRPGETIEDAAQVAQQCHINFTACAAMASALAARMCNRQSGRIGIIGSAAGFHSLPFAPSYAGSKAGLARFTDALRVACSKHRVAVTLATPGFIAAQRAEHDARARPFEISAEKAAAAIITAVMQGRAELIIPRRFAAVRWFDRILPRRLRDRLLLALPFP